MANLPTEYQEVEYIQSSGSQYIDTGFYPTGTSEIEFEFEYQSGSGAGSFGVDSGWTSNAFSVFSDRLLCYGSQYQSEAIYFTDNTKYKLVFNSSKQCYLNDVLRFTYTVQTFTSSYSAYVFAKRRNSSIEMYAKVKVYNLKLWNNGTLEREFIPCYRKSDNVIGMYDTVNNVFYTNQGTGTFTKGPDVIKPLISHGFIGTWHKELGWMPGANTLAYYTFDNQNLNDSSGNNNNGSWYNGNGSFVSIGDGYCVDLGGSHAIELPFTLANLTDWTLNIWIKINGDKTFNGILGTRTWGTGTMHINYAYSIPTVELAINPSADLNCDGTLNIGDWYNIVITKSGTTYSIYKNGSLGNSGTRPNFTDTSTLYLGMTYETARCLNGYLDKVIFENKARTAEEISNYYDSTKGNYGIN